MNHSRIRVAVLRGGPSYEYEDSLRSGGRVLSLLSEMREQYEPLDVFISKNGEWHWGGVVRKPEDILWQAHVAWNALHGPYGEDGQVQEMLEDLKVPFTGSTQKASILSMNKELAKRVFEAHGLDTPKHELLTESGVDDDRLIYIFRNYLHPVVVKPSSGSGWLGVRPAHTFSELKDAVRTALRHSPRVLVEEFVRGRVASCVVVEGARGERLHALMPVEVGKDEDYCPGSFPTAVNKRLEEAAKLAHEALGMRHYSVSDFVVTPRGKVYILETNASPKLHEDSLAHKALGATGWKPHHFLDHVIHKALQA